MLVELKMPISAMKIGRYLTCYNALLPAGKCGARLTAVTFAVLAQLVFVTLGSIPKHETNNPKYFAR